MTIICLRMPSGPPPLDEKRRRITIICLCVPSDTIVSEWRKGERNDHNLSPHAIGPAASGWQKAHNDHNLSLRAIEHDCVWMAKSERNDHNLSSHVIGPAVSGWQKVQNDHNLSLRAIRHDCVWMVKNEWNDHNLSLHVTWPQGQYDKDCGAADKSEALAPTYPQWGTQTYVVLDNYETKIVSVFSSLKCEHALVRRQNFQLIRVTYAFWMKNNVSTGEGEYADEIFS